MSDVDMIEGRMRPLDDVQEAWHHAFSTFTLCILVLEVVVGAAYAVFLLGQGIGHLLLGT